ncbi:MAG: alpha/beta fold hydrolase [Anaerolineales bacterium]|nr:alpha/beta fold hydrolase [Anaerolineales bacterium]
MAELNLVYRSRLPDAESVPPVVVLVHGWLGNEDAMWVFEQALPPGVAIFSPRAPLKAEGGYGWWMEKDDADGLRHGLTALREFITMLPRVHAVDPKRLVLVGFSQGAAVSAALLLSEPGLLCGVALLAGFLPEAARGWAAPGRLVGKRVFITHGLKDEIVPVAEARRAREIFACAGANVTYSEHPVAHKLSPPGLRELRRWLAATLA